MIIFNGNSQSKQGQLKAPNSDKRLLLTVITHQVLNHCFPHASPSEHYREGSREFSPSMEGSPPCQDFLVTQLIVPTAALPLVIELQKLVFKELI